MGYLPQDEDVFNERMRINEQDDTGIQNEAVVLKGLTKVTYYPTPFLTKNNFCLDKLGMLIC